MDADLHEWLAARVGGSTFTFNVEETITTALRCMRGDLPMALITPPPRKDGLEPAR